MLPDIAGTSSTRMHGLWLVVARVTLLAVMLLTIGLFVAGMPLFFAELQQVCAAPADTCFSRLTPDAARTLAELGFSLHFHALFTVILQSLSYGVYFVVGALIFWRKSDDWMALLVALFLVTFVNSQPLNALVRVYAIFGVPAQMVLFVGTIIFTLFFYLFPNGRFVPRWTCWLALVWIVIGILPVFFPDSPLNFTRWGIWFGLLIGAAQYGSFLFAQVYRYQRVSNVSERQQTRWVVVGVVMALLIIIATVVSMALRREQGLSILAFYTPALGFTIAPTLIPITIGVAILRYQLWDIDIIIRRTLIYSALTFMLGLVYIGCILVSRTLVTPLIGGSELAVVISTLAIWALFQPLRRRIQVIIDRRFYRRKYDAQKTLETYATHLRDETDLQHLTEDTLAVVQDTFSRHTSRYGYESVVRADDVLTPTSMLVPRHRASVAILR